MNDEMLQCHCSFTARFTICSTKQNNRCSQIANTDTHEMYVRRSRNFWQRLRKSGTPSQVRRPSLSACPSSHKCAALALFCAFIPCSLAATVALSSIESFFLRYDNVCESTSHHRAWIRSLCRPTGQNHWDFDRISCHHTYFSRTPLFVT